MLADGRSEITENSGRTVVVHAGRRFLSPLRGLARSFRLSRNTWKEKHHQVQVKLEQERQLSVERGHLRERGCERCESVELLSQQRLMELHQTRERMAQVEAELSKRVISGGGSEDRISEEAIPKAGATPIGVIDVAWQPVMQAGVALRAIPRVGTVHQSDRPLAEHSAGERSAVVIAATGSALAAKAARSGR